MIWTYSPDDPSLFSATDAAPRNALGLIGASIADPLRRALGWAAYGIAAGVRAAGACAWCCMSARRRAVSRAVTTPLALLAAAAFAATHVPPAGWANDYGLGGMLGDAVLGALLSALPFDVALALALVSLGLGAAFVAGVGLCARRDLGGGRAGSCAFSARARCCSIPARTA